MAVCFLFPGQGAQYPGMGKDLWEESKEVKELFELASDSVKMNLNKLLFNSTEEDLKATDKTQIAITLVNLSAGMILKNRGIIPDCAAGFSLGEYSALYEAGVITLEDIFPIVKARGIIMEEESRALDSPDGNPGMAAVIGLDYEKVNDCMQDIEGVYIANYNSPVQLVIAGTNSGINTAEEACKASGARRVIRLKVSGPFHSPLLTKASERLKDVLENYNFTDPKIPVYSNVTGNQIIKGADAKELCVKQVISTVKWVDVEKNLVQHDYSHYYEVGPGSVLSGLWRSFTKDISCSPAGKLENINKIK